MRWTEELDGTLEIELPPEFSYSECLVFLERSPVEVLHHIHDKYIYKLIIVNAELVLIKISYKDHVLIIEFPDREPPNMDTVVEYIRNWFDLNQDLSSFYEAVSEDSLLQPLIERYYGLRMIGIPDLFEALTWAIMGQQINLTFAYTLKKRLVENFGKKLVLHENEYWAYPSPEIIADLQVDDLRNLQFTTRKAEYVIGIAKEIVEGRLSKEKLRSSEDPAKQLISLRGIGPWTADYVLMKCLLKPDAFPVADVGLQNAVMKQLEWQQKPTKNELKKHAENWSGWEAYATFYLWRSLYE
ncbi:DNA-3-methyladenine glycosylase 2 family protein [Fictibacillus sp. 5RED26]|uniref:DNA-3-methyladenine glycosylase family protein n=1 Tax=unclassified Fictibacillus TaxID=2644029 RepID=UPI0018CFE880|nr:MULTISPECIES: DNA-3-methyladenine glycosylase [unclassified Fictibacillus]MBH0155133.1 DNA-3-methyladenine glycosylase 2 family protein [Fictibacillus sp. 5RED26]MBH0165083.1 DNA-3-methyladenine glycosylase 2 family protein [Fictibacillus sp. 7GRE50]